MIAYASRTGTKRNLAGLRAAGWRLMISARGGLYHHDFPYALDNGAWTSFREWEKGLRLSPQPCLRSFLRAVDRLGTGADFIVVPDIVQGGEQSWAMTRHWLRKMRRDRRLHGVRLLIAVQDGFDPTFIGAFLNERIGIFVGGSTDWKLETMDIWAALARRMGAYCHVGRVNTSSRIYACSHAEADSFDGSGPSRFAKILTRLDGARKQISMIPMMSEQ